ncbi:hypothetical protein [Novosphingobium pokkalii]|uniref:Uncharacterized protein n=1 Tax=Novosphingobium pokkalii TaxID=1770194 RepID=A0ABV7V4E5_9SPHN|nr:hypothetical protein [Novosphingobium pokkalii]
MTPTYDLLSRPCDFQLGNAGTAKDFQGCGQVVTQMPGRLAQTPETSAIIGGGEGFASAPRSSIVHRWKGFTGLGANDCPATPFRGCLSLLPQQTVRPWQRGLPGAMPG